MMQVPQKKTIIFATGMIVVFIGIILLTGIFQGSTIRAACEKDACGNQICQASFGSTDDDINVFIEESSAAANYGSCLSVVYDARKQITRTCNSLYVMASTQVRCDCKFSDSLTQGGNYTTIFFKNGANYPCDCVQDEEKCDGTILSTCTNGLWINKGDVPGKCGVTLCAQDTVCDDKCVDNKRYSQGTCVSSTGLCSYNIIEDCEKCVVDDGKSVCKEITPVKTYIGYVLLLIGLIAIVFAWRM